MSELDIITNISSEPVRPPSHITLEQIINEIPCMGYDNPTTYALYLHYNKDHLEQSEKDKVNLAIEKLKQERTLINQKNMKFMDDAKVKVEEP